VNAYHMLDRANINTNHYNNNDDDERQNVERLLCLMGKLA